MKKNIQEYTFHAFQNSVKLKTINLLYLLANQRSD